MEYSKKIDGKWFFARQTEYNPFEEKVLQMLQQIIDWQKSMDQLLEEKAEPLNKDNTMPEIKFPTNWLKANENINEGDTITFLNVGEQDKDGNWIFRVRIQRTSEEKSFQLNRTNFKIVSRIYGTNSDNWRGKMVKVKFIPGINPRTGEDVERIVLADLSGKVEEEKEEMVDEGLEKDEVL